MIRLLNKDVLWAYWIAFGAISPIAEQAGDLGEANMGRRAFILAQFVRKVCMYSGSPIFLAQS